MIKIYKVNKEHPELLDQLNKEKSCGTVLVYSDHCPHCVSMKPQWEQMKQNMHQKPANIYEINSEDLPYINHPIKNVVDGFPMILNVNDREIVPFEQERTLDNFIKFVESNIVNLKPYKKPENIRGNQIGNSLNLERYIDKKLPLAQPKKRRPKRSKQMKSKKAKNKNGKTDKKKKNPLRNKTAKKRKTRR